MKRAALALALAVPAVAHADSPAKPSRTHLHVELDPLPFALGGYGGQIGVRHPALRGVRVAVASFSLDVPDFLTEIGGNDGFHQTVEPSGALYVLYYLRPGGQDGFAVGGSLRYMRYRFSHDDMPNQIGAVNMFSPEAIVGYQWHPFENGFYVQPWFALGLGILREPTVAGHTYSAMPVSPFFTVNIGYEHAL